MSGASRGSGPRYERCSSLCTFPRPAGTEAWLRITFLRQSRREGFPEFTRFFNHDLSWKLRLTQPPALPIELPRSRRRNIACLGGKFNGRAPQGYDLLERARPILNLRGERTLHPNRRRQQTGGATISRQRRRPPAGARTGNWPAWPSCGSRRPPSRRPCTSRRCATAAGRRCGR